MDQEIKTDRLMLRPLRLDDDAAIAVAANDWDVARRLSKMPYPYGLKDAREWLGRVVDTRESVRAVEQDGQFLGVIGAEQQFGYWYGRHAWGKGIATEAGRGFLGEWYSTGGGDLMSGYLDDNHASRNVLQKLGFTGTGTEVIDTLVAKSVVSHRMHLTRADWLATHGLPIRTERLHLRPLNKADIPRLQAMAGRPEVARNLCSVKSPWPEEEVADWMRRSRFRGRVGFRLGIEGPEGRLIGSIGLGGDFQPSVSYFIDPTAQGQGYASEALAAMLTYGFYHYGLGMITADVFLDNPISEHVLRKAGFEQCGTEYASSAARVEPAPVYLYRLTRERFESLS